jgi:hypothetical protein
MSGNRGKGSKLSKNVQTNAPAGACSRRPLKDGACSGLLSPTISTGSAQPVDQPVMSASSNRHSVLGD